MATLPGSRVSVSAEASPSAGGTGYCVVLACVAKSADMKPRVFSSRMALLEMHGYSPGADYAALHIEQARQPVLFVPLPVETPGAVEDEDDSGVTGTSEVTVSAGPDGIMEEVDGILEVEVGGTIGTTGIVFTLSCDGGRTRKRVRLGTADSYTVPHLGIVVLFGDAPDDSPGTLLKGDRFTFRTSAPMWDGDGIAAARLGLAGQKKHSRSWLVVGDLPSALAAQPIVTAVNAYETANDRYVLARVQVADKPSGQAMSAWLSAMDTVFATVDAQKRLDIAIGRERMLSPITGWDLRRPAAWLASIREYQNDIHIPTWRKMDGPVSMNGLADADGNTVELDARIYGEALAARFTCLRTWSNGPEGTFIARSLTREVEGSVLGETHNMHVANLTCTIVQKVTENFIGRTPTLNNDGTLRPNEKIKLEEEVNAALAEALLREHVPGAGPRASKAVWTASPDAKFNVPEATLPGVAELHVNGTIVHVNTLVKVS